MPTDTIALLRAWATWSLHDAQVGPDDATCGSAESAYRSPQCWDETRAPRVVLIPDDEALRIERAVIGTGGVLAAALRAYFIRQHAPRRHAEVQMLQAAIHAVGELLERSQEPHNCPRSAPAGSDVFCIVRTP